MCLYPKLIKNRKYISNKKNGGNIPPITDERLKFVAVGCGKCMECKKQKARGWQVRLLEHIKTNNNGKFITLTFSDEAVYELGLQVDATMGYEKDNQIATLAMRKFLERYRKRYKKSLQHWMVTELGHNGTENIHLHGIIWTDNSLNTIERLWGYGHMWKGKLMNNGTIQNYVNEKTVNYIIKYITKIDEKHTEFSGKVLTSPGIGSNYINTYNARNNKFNDKNTDETYRTRTGHKIAMPIYWRNKLYSEKQREQLWLQKLDKEERWVCGERVSIKNNYNDYDALVQYHRMKNHQLGYGNDTKNYDRIQYEYSRRKLMQETRDKKAIAKRNKKRTQQH